MGLRRRQRDGRDRRVGVDDQPPPVRQRETRLELGVAERRRRRDAGRDGAGERGREPARARAEPFQVVQRVAAVVGLADQHPAPRADERADVVGHPPPDGRLQDVQHPADEHVGVATDVVAQDVPRVWRGHVERPEPDARCSRALRGGEGHGGGREVDADDLRVPARQRAGEPTVAAADVDDGQRGVGVLGEEVEVAGGFRGVARVPQDVAAVAGGPYPRPEMLPATAHLTRRATPETEDVRRDDNALPHRRLRGNRHSPV